MLAKMYLTNFLSFHERTEFDFTSSKYTILSETNVAENGLLKGALVIGANASGKSNALRGLKFIIDLIKGEGVTLELYRCNFAKEPATVVEYEFIFENDKLNYFISYDIKEEFLYIKLFYLLRNDGQNILKLTPSNSTIFFTFFIID